MKEARGHFNGKVVVLDEPAPVEHEVPVIIRFPETAAPQGETTRSSRKFHWDEAQAIDDGYAGSLADEVARQRRESRF